MSHQSEHLRLHVATLTPRAHKSAMGQFMTPASTARFMAAMFEPTPGPMVVLDPGAGLGALTSAVLERWKSGELGTVPLRAEAWEIDERLRAHLDETLAVYQAADGIDYRVHGEDFLVAAADAANRGDRAFTHVIANPPYKKINTNSDARRQTRRGGLETVNLYSAFVALALGMLRPGGQLVAIIPRSFANGPYYRPFRNYILEHSAIRKIHVFRRRNTAFKDDGVLQENVILMLERDGKQGGVEVSSSSDDSFADIERNTYPFHDLVRPDDPEQFFLMPEGGEVDRLSASPNIRHSLRDLDVQVSTGPVVDFRLRDHLRKDPGPDTVPLIYPGHFEHGRLSWPIPDFKKANAIARNASTEKWLYPGGIYTIVRRFSAKEERRRVVATLIEPDRMGSPEVIGLENHLNVFHQRKQGLPEDLAWGLKVYLNSTVVDAHFRSFNGHTQVNATDLKNMTYPSRGVLEDLGRWGMAQERLTQEIIDQQVEGIL